MVRLGNKRWIYAGVAAICIVAGGAALYLMRSSPSPVDGDQAAGTHTRRAPALPPADDAPEPTMLRREEAAHLVGEARRLAQAGDFAGADTALAAAEKMAPKQKETAQARTEIEAMKTGEGRFATLLAQARNAVDQEDAETANRLIGNMESLDANRPELATLRQELQDAQLRKMQRNTRVTALLKAMRDALARRDLAAAYRALNEAERIDVENPTVQQARAELDKAQDSDSR